MLIAAVAFGLALAPPPSVQDVLKAESERRGKAVAVLVGDAAVLNELAADFEAALRQLNGRLVEGENGIVIETPAMARSLAQIQPPAVSTDARLIHLTHDLIEHLGVAETARMLRSGGRLPVASLPQGIRRQVEEQIIGRIEDPGPWQLSLSLQPKLSLYSPQDQYFGVFLGEGVEGARLKASPARRAAPKVDVSQLRLAQREARFGRGAAIPLSEFIRPFAGSHLMNGVPDSLIWSYSPAPELLPQERFWLAERASGLRWQAVSDHFCLGPNPDLAYAAKDSADLLEFMGGAGLLPVSIEPGAFLSGVKAISGLDSEGVSALWSVARLGYPENSEGGIREVLADDALFRSCRAHLWVQGMLTLTESHNTLSYSFAIQ